MRILIVDDNDDKRVDVLKLLKEQLQDLSIVFEQAVDYESALEILTAGFFDLVIMDLLLPAADNPPSHTTSQALIRKLLKGDRLITPTHIIGLTAFEETENELRGFYDENLFALEIYNPVDDKWAKRLSGKIRYLVQSKRAAGKFQMNSYDFDVVVLAARHEFEYKPIKKALFTTGTTQNSYPLWSGEVIIGEFAGPEKRKLKAALICVGEMGMATTAAVAASAITVFRPRLISMVGMCCGFASDKCAFPRRLMDVIVVREVSCWEEGKYIAPGREHDPEFRNRSKTRLVNDAIRDSIDLAIETADIGLTLRMQKFARKVGYKSIIGGFPPEHVRPVPDIKFSSLVSGSSVIADQGMVDEILERHPSAIGLDMEIYGLYSAVDRCNGARPSVIGVKAVADFGGADKNDKAQEAASSVAAEVFKGLLEKLPIFQPSSV